MGERWQEMEEGCSQLSGLLAEAEEKLKGKGMECKSLEERHADLEAGCDGLGDLLAEAGEKIKGKITDYDALKKYSSNELEKDQRKLEDATVILDRSRLAEKDLRRLLKDTHETHKNIKVVAGAGWLVTFVLGAYVALSHYSTGCDDNPNLPAHTAATPANNAYHQKEEKTLVPDLGLPASTAGYVALPEIPTPAAPPAYDPMGKNEDQIMDDLREYAATQMDLGRTLHLGPGCGEASKQIEKIYERMNGTTEGLSYFVGKIVDPETCRDLRESKMLELKF